MTRTPTDPILAGIDAVRKARGITREEMARHAGVSTSTVNNAMSGRFNPNLDTITRMCVAVGAEIVVLEKPQENN